MFPYTSSRPLAAPGEADQNYLASAADLMIGLLFVFIIMVAFLALPSVKVDPASGVITLPEALLFDLGSSVLKESAVEKLGETSKQLGDVLKCFVANQMPKSSCEVNKYRHEIETIFIEGHTDNRPMNRVGGNVKLSLDRAISVNAVLVQGTSLAGFRNKDGHPIFSYSAYAENRPLIKADPSDGRNRRVDLRIVLTYRPPDTGSPIGVTKAVFKN